MLYRSLRVGGRTNVWNIAKLRRPICTGTLGRWIGLHSADADRRLRSLRWPRYRCRHWRTIQQKLTSTNNIAKQINKNKTLWTKKLFFFFFLWSVSAQWSRITVFRFSNYLCMGDTCCIFIYWLLISCSWKDHWRLLKVNDIGA